MVNKCSAINCRSGYSVKCKDPNVTFHSFPLSDKKLKNLVKNTARKDFTSTKYSRLCSLDFKVEDSSDQTQNRKRRRKDTKLLNRRLKKMLYLVFLKICRSILHLIMCFYQQK